MQTFTRHLLGALVLLAFGATSVVSAQVTQASPLTGQNLEQSQAQVPAFERFIPSTPVGPQASVVADTFYYEDFSDGLDGWTFENILPDTATAWEYITDPDLSARNGDARYANFDSPSNGNGFLFLDYPFYFSSRGIPNPFNNGYITMSQNAISPIIDFSNLDPSLTYTVNHFGYQPTLNSATSNITVRTYEDGVVTDAIVWQAVDEVARPNTVVPGLIISTPIPAAAVGVDSVQLIFAYQGDFYGWAVDDILVTTLAPIEVGVTDFIGIAPNLRTPAEQASGYEIPFIADVINNGAETVDINLAVSILDTGGMVIFTDTSRYTGIPTDSLAENQNFPNTFPMPTAEGVYTGVYEVFTDRISEDVNAANNTQTFQFLVGGNQFSKGPFQTGTRPAGGDVEYTFTNIYYTPNLTPDSTLQIDSLAFGCFPQNFTGDDEAFLEIATYGFRGDLNADGLVDYGDVDDQAAEMVELSIRELLIEETGSEVPGGVNIVITPDEDGDPIEISSEDDYTGIAVSMRYIPGSGGTNGDNVCFLGVTSTDYAGFGLAATQAGITDSLIFALAIDGSLDPSYTFFGGSAPALRLFTSYGDRGVNVTELPAQDFAVRPNPATTQFSIDFDFGTSVNAEFEIINAVGQVVSAFNRDGLSTGAITIPTNGMNNGLYYVKVRTNDGKVATRKLMLQR